MTAITFVGAGAGQATQTSVSSLALAYPAGIQAGDLLLALVESNSSGTWNDNSGSGWFSAALTNISTILKHILLYKIADGSESGTFSFGISAAGSMAGQMCAFRGVNQSKPMGASTDSAQTNFNFTTTFGPIHAWDLLAGQALLNVAWTQDGWTSISTTSGFTQIGAPQANNGSFGIGCFWQYLISTSDVAQSDITLTVNGQVGGSVGVGLSVVINPDVLEEYWGNSTGTGSVTSPASSTNVRLATVGGGGGTFSGTGAGASGEGGGYAKVDLTISSPGTDIVYRSTGGGGLGNNGSQSNGGDSWLRLNTNSAPSSSTDGCLAKGGVGASARGTAGTARTTSGQVGTTVFAGGAGTNAQGGGGSRGGSGGGSAGSISAAGTAGAAGSGSTAGAGGTNKGSSEGGDGGAGGSNAPTVNTTAGAWQGGGGGGGGSSSGTGSKGADGVYRIIFTISSGTNVGLTAVGAGQSATGAIGSLGISPQSFTLTGVQGTSAKGILGIGQALTGKQATGTAGAFAGLNSNVTPTGQTTGATNIGTLTAARAFLLAGVLATSALGTPAFAFQFTPTGVQAASAPGSLTASASFALTGQTTGATAIGILTPNSASTTNVPLTGFDSTAASGSLAPVLSVGITSSQLAGATGTLGISPQSFALTGVQATSAVHDLQADGGGHVNTSKLMLGVQATGSIGTLTPVAAFVLTGVQVTGGFGTLIPNQDTNVPLTGIQVSGATGSFGISPQSFGLTGVNASATAGSIAASLSQALSGNQATSAPGSMAGVSSIGITGFGSTGAKGSLGFAFFVPLTGQEATGNTGILTASGSSTVNIALTGFGAASAGGSLTPSLSLALAGKSASLAGGSLAPVLAITPTGQAATGGLGSLGPFSSIGITGYFSTGNIGTLVPTSYFVLQYSIERTLPIGLQNRNFIVSLQDRVLVIPSQNRRYIVPLQNRVTP